METSAQYWRKCSSCKSEIGYQKKFYECNVSTCNRKRTGLVFCSIPCFERHLPSARHRDAFAVEETSPSFKDWQREMETLATPQTAGTPSHDSSSMPAIRQNLGSRKIVPTGNSVPGAKLNKIREAEILVVASKVKEYIRRQSEMNTSADVLQILSDHLRSLCDGAIRSAREDGRKTVMARDFKKS